MVLLRAACVCVGGGGAQGVRQWVNELVGEWVGGWEGGWEGSRWSLLDTCSESAATNPLLLTDSGSARSAYFRLSWISSIIEVL